MQSGRSAADVPLLAVTAGREGATPGDSLALAQLADVDRAVTATPGAARAPRRLHSIAGADKHAAPPRARGCR